MSRIKASTMPFPCHLNFINGLNRYTGPNRLGVRSWSVKNSDKSPRQLLFRGETRGARRWRAGGGPPRGNTRQNCPPSQSARCHRSPASMVSPNPRQCPRPGGGKAKKTPHLRGFLRPPVTVRNRGGGVMLPIPPGPIRAAQASLARAPPTSWRRRRTCEYRCSLETSPLRSRY